MVEQCCKHSKQCRNNVVMLRCAKNRRFESSRVTSPLELLHLYTAVFIFSVATQRSSPQVKINIKMERLLAGY